MPCDVGRWRVKGSVLRALETMLTQVAANPERRAVSIGALQGEDPNLLDLAEEGGLVFSDADKAHLETHWFGSWWPELPVNRIVARAMIVALERAGENALPIDMWWQCLKENEEFAVSVSWSASQVTCVLHTPPAPADAVQGMESDPVRFIKRVGEEIVVEE